jgi:hypothetical protein
MTAIEEPTGQLPILRARRLEHMPEEVRYVARPGLAALPTGTGTVLLFLSPQVFSVMVLLWAIWWPTPGNWRTFAFAMFWTSIIAALAIGVAWTLLRRHPGFVMGLLPWERTPLLEIDRRRVTGGILGTVDKRGRGNAAMMLVPGDPSADVDGNIHFDRLPNVARFVAALGQME